jgi:hypothetical protein
MLADPSAIGSPANDKTPEAAAAANNPKAKKTEEPVS